MSRMDHPNIVEMNTAFMSADGTKLYVGALSVSVWGESWEWRVRVRQRLRPCRGHGNAVIVPKP